MTVHGRRHVVATEVSEFVADHCGKLRLAEQAHRAKRNKQRFVRDRAVTAKQRNGPCGNEEIGLEPGDDIDW